jgi:hypothetical protein
LDSISDFGVLFLDRTGTSMSSHQSPLPHHHERSDSNRFAGKSEQIFLLFLLRDRQIAATKQVEFQRLFDTKHLI